MSFFAKILIRTVSTQMNQLNIPLHPLETCYGMSNEVLHICEAGSGKVLYACWLRKSIRSGRVVYSGFYSCTIFNQDAVKVKHIPLREQIHIFEDKGGMLRTDHEFWFMGFKMLHLHYKIISIQK